MRKVIFLLYIISTLLLGTPGCETTPIKKDLAPPYEISEASFRVIDWEQGYLQYDRKYNIAQVYYEAINKGTEDIDFFKILIEVTCSDGNTYSQ